MHPESTLRSLSADTLQHIVGCLPPDAQLRARPLLSALDEAVTCRVLPHVMEDLADTWNPRLPEHWSSREASDSFLDEERRGIVDNDDDGGRDVPLLLPLQSFTSPLFSSFGRLDAWFASTFDPARPPAWLHQWLDRLVPRRRNAAVLPQSRMACLLRMAVRQIEDTEAREARVRLLAQRHGSPEGANSSAAVAAQRMCTVRDLDGVRAALMVVDEAVSQSAEATVAEELHLYDAEIRVLRFYIDSADVVLERIVPRCMVSARVRDDACKLQRLTRAFGSTNASVAALILACHTGTNVLPKRPTPNHTECKETSCRPSAVAVVNPGDLASWGPFTDVPPVVLLHGFHDLHQWVLLMRTVKQASLWVAFTPDCVLPPGAPFLHKSAWTFVDARCVQQPGTTSDVAVACPKLQQLLLPQSVGGHGIAAESIRVCPKLRVLQLPGDSTTVPRACMQGCENLRALDLPLGITEIGSNSIIGAATVTVVDLRRLTRLTVIGARVLSDMRSVQEVFLPSSVQAILEQAVSQLPSLHAVHFGGEGDDESRLSNISVGVLHSCPLLRRLDLPAALETIGPIAYDCAELAELDFSRCSRLRAVAPQQLAKVRAVVKTRQAVVRLPKEGVARFAHLFRGARIVTEDAPPTNPAPQSREP